MASFVPPYSKAVFDEVAIADFNHFQTAVLTTTDLVNRRVFSAQIPVPERRYQTHGWLISDHQLISYFDGLTIGKPDADDALFKPVRRISPSVPVSFDVASYQPLATKISSQASLVCRLPETHVPYLTIFHQISPRFVRIYPFGNSDSLLAMVDQMLTDQAFFISANYERLKHIPFYQHRFGL